MIFSFFMFSCRAGKNDFSFSLDDTFYWAECDESSTIDDAQNCEFQKLSKMEYRNISDVAGTEGSYVWLKAEFDVPEELRNQNLSLVIPYIHYAASVYLNGRYIADCGSMGSEIQDAGYKSYQLFFPKAFLNQYRKNTVYIKVFSLGKATISDGIILTTKENGEAYSGSRNFWQSTFYMIFEGGMIVSMLIFILLFLYYKKEVSYLFFALLNFFSIIFFLTFFMNTIPGLSSLKGNSYLVLLKITRCLSFVGMEYMFVLFVFSFIKIKHHIVEIILRSIFSILCVLQIIFARDYVSLMKVAPFILGFSGIDVLLSFGMIIKSLFSKCKEEQYLSKVLLTSMIPLFISFILDIIFKVGLRDIKMFYFSLPGYQVSILCIFIYFCLNYKKASVRLEYLNTELENEVLLQTKKLTRTNEALENEIQATKNDMRTAAIVQKKLFHLPEEKLEHWEIAVTYEPYSIVSGDLYNFYNVNDTLYGVSIFDTSGHGIAASLITMLAENVVSQVFNEGYLFGENVETSMGRINERFISAKGTIENYMTGLLVKIKELNDECELSISNAGHPSPEFYNAETNTVEEVLQNIEDAGVGPIGISGLDTRYSSVKLNMKKDDILILFTDGLTEAANPNRTEFGRNKIRSIIKETHQDSAELLLKKIKLAQAMHVGTAPLSDDTTIIVMKRK